MRLLVFGASGKCGSWVVREASTRGHSVTAVVRNGTPYTPPAAVKVVRGDVTDAEFFREQLGEHTHLISGLGLRRASIVPWSRLFSPPDLVQRVSAAIAEHGEHLERFVWISAGGVGASRESTSPIVRRMIDAGNIGVAYRDLAAAEEILSKSTVNSIAVRPVTLRPGGPTGRGGEIARYGLWSFVRRADVARWMVDVVDGTRRHEGSDVLLGTVDSRET